MGLIQIKVSTPCTKHLYSYVIPWSSQPYGRKALRVQRGFWDGDFGFHGMLKIESNDFLIMM